MTAARMHEFELRHSRFKPAMLTLTYREIGQWNPRHISDLLQRIRVWLRAGPRLRYVWVAELRARRVHYHAVLWLPRGLTLPKPDNKDGGPMDQPESNGPGSPLAILRSTPPNSTQRLALASPWSPSPRARRSRGIGRSVSQWFNLPQWAREVCDLAGRAVRVKGCGLVNGIRGFACRRRGGCPAAKRALRMRKGSSAT